ncbi:uncharacterized protein [Triticum aestivum]|uniref:uncharacterized protein isoform X2 n=1 Tax=Triticum aestivum TaxID=4565 RepID=UPI001D01DF45|nr:uncharacterized protein LOC123053911 isoform X2 [Triticum aestivum]
MSPPPPPPPPRTRPSRSSPLPPTADLAVLLTHHRRPRPSLPSPHLPANSTPEEIERAPECARPRSLLPRFPAPEPHERSSSCVFARRRRRPPATACRSQQMSATLLLYSLLPVLSFFLLSLSHTSQFLSLSQTVHFAAMDARVPDLAARRPDAKSLLVVPAPLGRSLAQVQAPPTFASSPWPPLLRLLRGQSSVSVNVSSRRLCSLSGSIDSSSTPTVSLRSAPELAVAALFSSAPTSQAVRLQLSALALYCVVHSIRDLFQGLGSALSMEKGDIYSFCIF